MILSFAEFMRFCGNPSGCRKGMSTMDDNHDTELPVESEELPPLGSGRLRPCWPTTRACMRRTGRELRILDVQFHVGRKLASILMIVAGQVRVRAVIRVCQSSPVAGAVQPSRSTALGNRKQPALAAGCGHERGSE